MARKDRLYVARRMTEPCGNHDDSHQNAGADEHREACLYQLSTLTACAPAQAWASPPAVGLRLAAAYPWAAVSQREGADGSLGGGGSLRGGRRRLRWSGQHNRDRVWGFGSLGFFFRRAGRDGEGQRRTQRFSRRDDLGDRQLQLDADRLRIGHRHRGGGRICRRRISSRRRIGRQGGLRRRRRVAYRWAAVSVALM